jgi:hypothetical protein
VAAVEEHERDRRDEEDDLVDRARDREQAEARERTQRFRDPLVARGDP